MFRYPGGKNKVRHQIYDVLVERRAFLSDDAEFREPFIGGGAITKFCLNKKLTSRIWVNDIDPGISSIWHCAINESENFIQMVNDYIPSVDDYWTFKKELKDKKCVDRFSKLELAFKKLVVHQFSYSGLGVKSGSPIGGKTQVDKNGLKKKYAFDCRWSPKNIIKEISLFHQSLNGVKIRENTCTQLDYRQLLLDKTYEGLIYLDPPYYEQGESLYQFFFTKNEHIEMANILRNTPHEWVLSYDNHPTILKLYDWAHIMPLDVMYSINSKGGMKSKEIIITKKK